VIQIGEGYIQAPEDISSLGFAVHAKQMRPHRFLDELDVIIPWSKLCRRIEAH
jgi:hypothetical protein